MVPSAPEDGLPTRTRLPVAVSGITAALAATIVLSSQSRPGPDAACPMAGPIFRAFTTLLRSRRSSVRPGQPFELTDDQVRIVDQRVLSLVALANRPSSPTRTAPPVGGDGSTGNSGNVGGYNVYWIGGLPSRVTVLDGLARGSLIIDPRDGLGRGLESTCEWLPGHTI